MVDGTTVGCASRYDDTDSPKAAVALGYTDASSYSCKLEPLQGVIHSGFVYRIERLHSKYCIHN